MRTKNKAVFSPILETPGDVARIKAETRRDCGYLRHELGGWKKWTRREIGGTLGWVRVARCLKCRQKVYIHSNGTRLGWPVTMACRENR